MPERLEKYVLLTGSDLGDRNANLEAATSLINQRIGRIVASSSVVETEPWGFESDTLFLNQALLVETYLDPESLLKNVLEIEREIGRERKEIQWTSRIIDIDIVCSENRSYHSDNLTIPHKHLHERSFVLNPLCQLVPNWIHPLLQKSYAQLLVKLNQAKAQSILS